jgi:hypothetical protein
MTEAEELQKIKAFVAEPTEEGFEQLLHLMDTSAFNMVKLEAASAILEIGHPSLARVRHPTSVSVLIMLTATAR